MLKAMPREQSGPVVIAHHTEADFAAAWAQWLHEESGSWPVKLVNGREPLEPGTVFHNRPPPLPDDDLAFSMQQDGDAHLASAGFTQYEVSAYAKLGRQCRHNLNYWRFGDYLGIGAGAHGKLSFAHRIVRQVRFRDPQRYMTGALAGAAVAHSNEVALAELPFEFMLNALRLVDGFTLAQFAERTGLALTVIQRGMEQAERQGLVARDLHRVWPTARGLDFLNDLQTLFLP